MENKPEQVKEQTYLERVESIAKKKFDASVAIAEDLKVQATAIIVKDDMTLAMATQLLSKVKESENLAEKNRKSLKQPYIDAGKLIDQWANKVLGPLGDALTTGKGKIKEWNEKQDKIKRNLESIVKQISKKADLCTTPETCQTLIENIEKAFEDTSKYGAFAEEAVKQKKIYVDLLTLKKQTLATVAKGGAAAEKAVEAMKEAEEAAVENKESIKDTLSASAVKSSVRKTWKAEVVNEADLPREWMMVDMDKVKAHMRANQETMKSGTIFNGVKFFIDEGVMIR